jgi:hypothetical protein
MKTSYFANGFSSFFAFAASFLYLMPVFYLLLRSAVANVDDSPVSSLRQREIRVKSTRERRSSWIYTQYHQIGKQRKNKYNSISEPRHWELSRGFLGMFDLINIERTRDSSIVGGYNNIAQEKRRVLCARISQLSFFLFLTINPQQHRSIRRSRMIVRISISCLKMKNIYGDCNGVINIRVHAVLLKLISAWKRNFLK